MKRRLAVPCCSVAPAPAAFGCRPASPAHGSSLSLCRGSAVRGGRGDSPPCASPRRWLPGGSLLLCCCCTCAPTRERRENERTPPFVLCSSFRPLAWRRPYPKNSARHSNPQNQPPPYVATRSSWLVARKLTTSLAAVCCPIADFHLSTPTRASPLTNEPNPQIQQLFATQTHRDLPLTPEHSVNVPF